MNSLIFIHCVLKFAFYLFAFSFEPIFFLVIVLKEKFVMMKNWLLFRSIETTIDFHSIFSDTISTCDWTLNNKKKKKLCWLTLIDHAENELKQQSIEWIDTLNIILRFHFFSVEEYIFSSLHLAWLFIWLSKAQQHLFDLFSTKFKRRNAGNITKSLIKISTSSYLQWEWMCVQFPFWEFLFSLFRHILKIIKLYIYLSSNCRSFLFFTQKTETMNNFQRNILSIK